MNNIARLAIAAAAVVVVAIAGYNLLPGGSGPGGSYPTPSPTLAPSDAPTPSPSPTPGTTFPALYSTHPGGGTLLAPGDWVITAVEPLRITITVPDGWYKGRLEWAAFPEESSPSVTFTVADNVRVDPCNPAAGYFDPAVGSSVDHLVAAMGAVPGIEAGEPTDVTIDGYSGKYIVLSKPAGDAPCAGGVESSLWFMDIEAVPAPGPGDEHRHWVVDVDGIRLIVSILGQQTAEPGTAAAEAIVNSIQIDPQG